MIQASIDDDNKVDETTVQWAREALQRRRKEMRQQKEDLIASYRQDVMARDSVSLTSAASPTHPMIERGKMILAETEARSDILIRYASFQNSINMTPTSTPQQQTIAPNLPIESSPYSWDEDVECEEVGSSDNDELLTEDEARAKLQELIATMNRNRRDDDVMDLSRAIGPQGTSHKAATLDSHHHCYHYHQINPHDVTVSHGIHARMADC